jgi:hypothetical protein
LITATFPTRADRILKNGQRYQLALLESSQNDNLEHAADTIGKVWLLDEFLAEIPARAGETNVECRVARAPRTSAQPNRKESGAKEVFVTTRAAHAAYDRRVEQRRGIRSSAPQDAASAAADASIACKRYEVMKVM